MSKTVLKSTKKPSISVLLPFYNERENLPLLLRTLKKVLQQEHIPHQIICINDGSTDMTERDLSGIKKYAVLLTHRKRFGKGKALETGMSQAKGEILVLMDADLQNDPIDLPKFIKKIREGYDFVNGWRKVRNDGADKTFPSRFYNWLIQRTFGIQLHDINCGFKAMTRQVIDSVQLYGDNYRILPILAKHEGFLVGEVVVVHHARKYGVSKFGFWRLFFGFFDVMSYAFLLRFVEKPLHFFGIVGSTTFLIGALVLAELGIERLVFNHLIYRRPILFVGIMLVIVGVQIIVTGFIGELVVYLHKRNSRT